MGILGKYFGGSDEANSGQKAAFNKWLSSNYGPPGRISKSDLNALYAEWMKKQGNALGGKQNALSN